MERESMYDDFKYHTYDHGDDIDLLQILCDIKERWVLLIIVTGISSVLAVLFALSIPKQYEADAIIAPPSDADVLALNSNPVITISAHKLFQLYLDKLKSTDNFVQFIAKNGFVELIYPDSQLDPELISARFARELSLSVLDEVGNTPGEAPIKIIVKLIHHDEAISVKIVNQYIDSTSQILLQELKAQYQSIKAIQIDELKREIKLLRENGREDRLREIALIEDENRLKLENLNKQYHLVIGKSKQDKATQIAETMEALEIARKLSISIPTPIWDFKERSSEVGSASINMDSDSSLPLYLMGTTFLNSLIESLKSRENEEVYIRQLNQIAMDISSVKDDKYLKSLKSRTSDDFYIPELAGILQELRKLESSPQIPDGILPMSIAKSARVDGTAVRPNRPLIVILGSITGFIISIIVIPLFASLQRRAEQ